MQETCQSLGWEDPLEKGMETHSSILAGEFHGQRSMTGYSPRGRKESDMTEWLTHPVLKLRMATFDCDSLYFFSEHTLVHSVIFIHSHKEVEYVAFCLIFEEESFQDSVKWLINTVKVIDSAYNETGQSMYWPTSNGQTNFVVILCLSPPAHLVLQFPSNDCWSSHLHPSAWKPPWTIS